MTVLSDSEIRRLIDAGELVPNGDTGRADECSYSFRAGLAFIPGDDCEPIEFQTPDGPSSVTVHPGKMVWIRTSERVRIPTNMVGFWWQTNTLSRKGLMLINMSMVEPGYEGDLACLFVNFGSSKVIIDANTVVAKMVFVNVQGTVDHPFPRCIGTAEYDARLRELALNQPGSFLQISDLAVDLNRQKDEVIAEVRRVGADVRSDAARAMTGAKEDALNEFKADAPKAAWKTLGWGVAGLALLTIADVGASWIKEHAFNDPKKIARSEAEAVLRERVTIAGTANPSLQPNIDHSIKELSDRITRLESGKK